MTTSNFGRNINIRPTVRYTPRSEEEILEILNRHQGQRIRCVGRLHSWSRILEADAVLLDLRELNDVRTDIEDGKPVVHVSAGCQVKCLLSELEKQRDWTLPSVGFITEQSIAGAISTGTHGSGRHSLSHYVLRVRIARYSAETGKAYFETISGGTELLAARCSLGCLGVIVSVTMQCRPQYQVEESFLEYRQLSDVLDAEDEFPLQQFYLVPWRWTYFAQHRRETDTRSSRTLSIYLCYRFLVFDIGMHLLILTVVRLLKISWVIRTMLRRLIPTFVIQKWSVVGTSSQQLVMEHELFRHVEIELFVQRSQLPDALQFLKDTLIFAGHPDEPATTEFQTQVERAHCTEHLSTLRGSYCHHYPICVRRILPDDTLISMASNVGYASPRIDECWYSITLTNYHRGTARKPFDLLATFIAVSMCRLFAARPHWGKICPLKPTELRSLYPSFSVFQDYCTRLDATGVFRNEWTAELLSDDGTRHYNKSLAKKYEGQSESEGK